MKEFRVERDKLVKQRRPRPEIGRDIAMYLLGRYSHQKELRDKVEGILLSTFKV